MVSWAGEGATLASSAFTGPSALSPVTSPGPAAAHVIAADKV